ncbi:hypothetical protein NUU61_000885 [Penicillium alfredii]|uniref:Uncharacterized protein n=1 Tax=Penicillium alfredii TaxID=1506179 RepID=A0A9W9KRG0_9EURO|nr:uncharacterized protein NUU61_000885 [Penicillium alfredii]KAJ5115126.1 hypothetical protein NUU61_000885 [Penicillium alfredii]
MDPTDLSHPGSSDAPAQPGSRAPTPSMTAPDNSNPIAVSRMTAEPGPRDTIGTSTAPIPPLPNPRTPTPAPAGARVYPWTERGNMYGYDVEGGHRLRERYERENPYQSRTEPAPRRRSRSPAGLPLPQLGPWEGSDLRNGATESSLSPLFSRDNNQTRTERHGPLLSLTLPPLDLHNHEYREEREAHQESLPNGHGHNQRRVQPQQGLINLEQSDRKKPEDASLCEFSSPCRMAPSPDGMHFRKVVSHVFGRNKTTTKLFPRSVWVHYCRKHYQRARYRADQWPFTQCELLLESLNRMEAWGGVESFELILRRREMMRTDEANEPAGSSGTGRSSAALAPPASFGALQSGRRHPTAIISPVPDWLRVHLGPGKSFAEIRRIVMQVREHMITLRNDEKNRQILLATRASVASPRESPKGGCGGGGSGRRATPNRYKNTLRQQISRVRFPDVEILPTFRMWVLEAALRQRSSTDQVSEEKEVNGEHGENSQRSSARENDEDTVQHGNSSIAPVSVPAHVPAASDSQSAGQEIGRAGTNRGGSESQRRRSARLFLRMATRVSSRGSVKKPHK